MRILDDFSGDREREALFRYLCASPQWRVTPGPETTGPEKGFKYIQAEKSDRCPQSTEERFVRSNRLTVTARFNFPLPGNSSNDIAKRATPVAKSVDVLLSPSSVNGQDLDSTLLIASGVFSFTIAEHSSGRDRWLTQEAMQQLADELAEVKDNLEQIERDGYSNQWLSTGFVRESSENIPLQIREDSNRGIYRVSGYVNPQESGYITIRAIHAATGRELDADQNSRRSLQYVGWSPRPNVRFYFEFELMAPSYLTEEQLKFAPEDPRRLEAMSAEQEIRVEVWFHGKEERKLLDATKRLVPWMR
jgi:hypothetical protein